MFYWDDNAEVCFGDNNKVVSAEWETIMFLKTCYSIEKLYQDVKSGEFPCVKRPDKCWLNLKCHHMYSCEGNKRGVSMIFSKFSRPSWAKVSEISINAAETLMKLNK